jgi:replicative DNA helicase
MIPDVRTYEERQDSKEVWIQLRGIAGEEDAAVLTATQTNREGFKASTAKAEHAAEDFNKIRIADLVISINRSDEEKDKGEARLYFAASRNQGGEFCLRVKQNMGAMQFITAVVGIE